MCVCEYLEDEIAAVHCVVKVFAADVLDAVVQVEPADFGVVDSTGARRLDQVGAVRRRQCVQRDRVLALGPGQCCRKGQKETLKKKYSPLVIIKFRVLVEKGPIKT